MQKSPEPPEHSSATRGSSHARPLRSRPTRRHRWGVAAAITLVLALIVSTVVRIFAVDIYEINQDSMSPTVADGERVLVDKQYPGAAEPAPGDVVVFDGEGSFTPYRGGAALNRSLEQVGHWLGLRPPPGVFIKRVIGTEGDLVVCCDADGQLTLNGEPVEEAYLAEAATAEVPASDITFEAEIPPGRMWVMGDNRQDSLDSRDLLGAPGGGMISHDRIIGRATTVVWPWPDRRSLEGDRP